MVPSRCNLGITPIVTYQVYRDNLDTEMIFESWEIQTVPKPFLLTEDQYEAGETFVVLVDVTWLLNDVRDYTVSVYSK